MRNGTRLLAIQFVSTLTTQVINKSTLQLIEKFHFILKMELSPTLQKTEYMLEFLDSVQINLDAFLLRICTETATCFTSALKSLLDVSETPQDASDRMDLNTKDLSSNPSSSIEPLGTASAETAHAADAIEQSAPQSMLAAIAFKDISVLLVSSLSHSPTPVARIYIAHLSAGATHSETGAQVSAPFFVRMRGPYPHPPANQQRSYAIH